MDAAALAGLFPMLLVPADRALLFGSFIQWGPMVIAIAVALLVAAVIRRDRLDPGSGPGLVGGAPAGVDFVKPACADS